MNVPKQPPDARIGSRAWTRCVFGLPGSLRFPRRFACWQNDAMNVKGRHRSSVNVRRPDPGGLATPVDYTNVFQLAFTYPATHVIAK